MTKSAEKTLLHIHDIMIVLLCCAGHYDWTDGYGEDEELGTEISDMLHDRLHIGAYVYSAIAATFWVNFTERVKTVMKTVITL